YIFVPGYGWLFPTAVLATAGAGFAVLYELTRSLPQPRLSLRLTVLLASLCCLLVALFPTDRAGPLTLSAEIHRYAAGAAFCCVPLAAWLLSRDPFVLRTRTHHAARLHRMTVVSAVILVVVLTSLLGLLPDAVHRIRGLLQRIQFLAQLAILAQLLRTLRVGPQQRRYVPRRRVCLRPWPTHSRGQRTRVGLRTCCQRQGAVLPSPYGRLRRDHLRGRRADRHHHPEPPHRTHRLHRPAVHRDRGRTRSCRPGRGRPGRRADRLGPRLLRRCRPVAGRFRRGLQPRAGLGLAGTGGTLFQADLHHEQTGGGGTQRCRHRRGDHHHALGRLPDRRDRLPIRLRLLPPRNLPGRRLGMVPSPTGRNGHSTGLDDQRT